MHGRVYVNQLERTLTGVRKLLPADVQRQTRIMDACIDALLQAGTDAPEAWRSLADTSNLAETLAGMRLGGGASADQIIGDAQLALAWMAQERQERGTWALRGDERTEVRMRLELLRDLHRTQLAECSYGEFERAYRTTVERMQQARAGNAAAGAVVVEGVL